MPNSLMPKYGFIFAQYNETAVWYLSLTMCLKIFRELFIKQESLKAISSRVLLLTCSELISKQIHATNTIYLIFKESYIMVTYGTGYLLSSFTSQCIMDFIISEEATAFSRDYSQLKKVIPGHSLALKWHYYHGTKNGKVISGKHI